MARIYNQDQYEGAFNPSQQSRGFNAVQAADATSKEKEKMQAELRDIETQTTSMTRQQKLDKGILDAQHSIEKANFQAKKATIDGILQLSSTAVKAFGMVAEEQAKEADYQNQCLF